MTREKFAEILKEYEFTDHQIELLWDPDNEHPLGLKHLDEQTLRKAAKVLADMKKKSDDIEKKSQRA